MRSWPIDAPLVLSTASRFSVQDDLRSNGTAAAEEGAQWLRLVQVDPDPSLSLGSSGAESDLRGRCEILHKSSVDYVLLVGCWCSLKTCHFVPSPLYYIKTRLHILVQFCVVSFTHLTYRIKRAIHGTSVPHLANQKLSVRRPHTCGKRTS